MPKQGDKKPCSETGCSGTKVYDERYIAPGGTARFPHPGRSGPIIEPHAAWICDTCGHEEKP